MRVLAIHDRPGWSMEHHCRDLRQTLHHRCEVEIVSCGKQWEDFDAVVASLDDSYDRIYVAGEFLGMFLSKAVSPALHSRMLLGVHSYFLWDRGQSVGPRLAQASTNPDLVAAARCYRAVGVICESLVRALQPMRAYLTPYGVNTDVFHPASSSRRERARLRVGWVGAQLPHKNHRLFLEVRERLADVADCVDLVVCRDGYYADRGVLTRADMNQFYNELDVLLVTADSEGGPLPPLEASACGVPVITPPIGCMPEFVRNGVDGFLAATYDAEEYAGLVRALHQDRNRLLSMRQACMEKAFGEWSMEAKAEAWWQFFATA